jgi:tetratricopeptide (TPR) repeat protein
LATEEERYQDAVPLLQQVVKDEPGIALANLELGRAFNGLGRFGEAIPWLRKAVELTPESGRAHYELGVALGETGDWSGSAAQLEAAVARAPDSDDLHFYLAMADDRIDRIAEAEKNFREALRINPAHYRANLFLGRLLGMHERPGEAITCLQTAAKLDPKSPDPHKFLANVYILLGRTTDANREREEAGRLGSAQP